MPAIHELFQSIRRRCSKASWSRGAQLARIGAVVGVRNADTEVELKIQGRRGELENVVTLFLDEEDWACDCTSREEVCMHVAAASMAMRVAQRDGKELPGAHVPAKGHIGYRFERQEGRLALRRVVVVGKHEVPLEGNLASVNGNGDVNRPAIGITPQDQRIEQSFGSFVGGPIPQAIMPRMLEALLEIDDMKLNGRPVKVGRPASGLCVRVEECGLGFRLRLDQDPIISEVFKNGALRRGIKLMALVPHGLGERQFHELRTGKIYDEGDVGTLVGEVLPKLEKQLPVRVDTPKLPKRQTLKPHLSIATMREDEHLVLHATIVYGDPPRATVDGERLILLSGKEAPVRDIVEEQRLRRVSHGMGLETGVKRSFPARQAILVAERLRQNTDEQVMIEGAAHLDFYDGGDVAPHLDIKEDGDFDLWFTAEGGTTSGSGAQRADPGAVVGAWERGEQLVPLLGGGFGHLPTDWLQKYGHRVADLLSARKAMEENGTLGHAAGTLYTLPDLAELAKSLNQPPPPRFEKLKTLVQGFDGIPHVRLPKIEGTLRDYQLRGVDWLCFLRDLELGALLADDMGLGKTLQTLCALRGKALVVAPTSVLHNWATEITRFRSALKMNVYHGPDRKLSATANVTLTTYAVLRLDAEQLAERMWDVVVLDEAQAIKNPTSQVAKAAYSLPAHFRIALTGTPVENRLEDLWSQFHFLNRGLLGGRQDFHERYVKPIAAGDPSAAGRLRERLKPFILRRMKSEVAKELPPRTEVVLRCELSKPEREVYDAVRAATKKEVAKKLDSGGNTLAILEALLRLRQAACHPSLIPGQKSMKEESSAKLELLAEVLEEAMAEDHKALVFSQWTSLLDLVMAQLDKAQTPYVRLDGRTRDRKKVVTEFQSPDGPKVMLVSLKAGGTGLNLTAADHVILLDPWWNPAVEDQAADRAHRIGQTRPVIVHRLVAEGTVEERILDLQLKKRELANAALGDTAMAHQITRDELLALLD